MTSHSISKALNIGNTGDKVPFFSFFLQATRRVVHITGQIPEYSLPMELYLLQYSLISLRLCVIRQEKKLKLFSGLVIEVGMQGIGLELSKETV